MENLPARNMTQPEMPEAPRCPSCDVPMERCTPWAPITYECDNPMCEDCSLGDAKIIESLRTMVETLERERDEARRTAMHALDVSGRKIEKLEAEVEQNNQERAEFITSIKLSVEYIERLEAEVTRLRDLLRDCLDAIEHSNSIDFSNGVVAPDGSDEGTVRGNEFLLKTVKKSAAALGPRP